MSLPTSIATADWMRVDLSEFRCALRDEGYSVRQSVEADPAPGAAGTGGPVELGLTVEVGLFEDGADEPSGSIRVHGFGQFSYLGGDAAGRGPAGLRSLERSGYAILYGHISDHVNRLMLGAGERDFWLPHLPSEAFEGVSAGDDAQGRPA